MLFIKNFKNFLESLIESEELLNKKFRQHREFSAAMFFLSAILACSLWIWDRVIDPQSAAQTLILRLAYIYLAVIGFIFQISRNKNLLSALSVLSIILAEIIFIKIIIQLDLGMQYGIGGFMYFIFMPLLLLICFSWKTNLFCTFLAGLFPHVAAILGLAPKFEHANYAVLIWPTVGLMTMVNLVLASSYKKRYSLEQALELASNTDPLTGLNNRRHFMATLQKEWTRQKRFGHKMSIIVLDIDNFKKINDTFGHLTGDIAISTIGRICNLETRGSDCIGRLGGEEFAILLPETDLESAGVFAERIRSSLETSKIESIDGRIFNITTSIGVSESNENYKDVFKWLDAADHALYSAKNTGKNKVCFAADS